MASTIPTVKLDENPVTRIVVGRGKGRCYAYVFDLGRIGTGRALHVIRIGGGSVCGRKGEMVGIEKGVDAHAVRLGQNPVCVECLRHLGEIPYARRVDE